MMSPLAQAQLAPESTLCSRGRDVVQARLARLRVVLLFAFALLLRFAGAFFLAGAALAVDALASLSARRSASEIGALLCANTSRICAAFITAGAKFLTACGVSRASDELLKMEDPGTGLEDIWDHFAEQICQARGTPGSWDTCNRNGRWRRAARRPLRPQPCRTGTGSSGSSWRSGRRRSA